MSHKVLVIVLSLAISACTTTASTTPTVASPEHTPTLQASLIVAPTLQASTTIAPTIKPVATSVPLVHTPPGIVYRTDVGLWRVSVNGGSELLLDVPKNAPVKLSPDTTRGLYEIEDRHFLIEFSSGAQVEMMPDEGYAICWTEWWTARPDIVLAMVQPVSEIGGMYCKGIPAAWTLAGEGFRLLGNEPTEAYPFAPSPNGDAVAFDQAGQPRLYQWDSDAIAFDMESFGFPSLMETFATNPAWSPRGRYLAWVIAGKLNGERQHGVGVFNLLDHTSQFLYPFEVEGFDGGRSYIVWNPDEERFALSNFGRELLWILSVEGIELYRAESAYKPVWSPDGKWLTYFSYPKVIVVSADGKEKVELADGESVIWSPDSLRLAHNTWSKKDGWRTWITTVGEWQPQRLDLPQDALLVDWFQVNSTQ